MLNDNLMRIIQETPATLLKSSVMVLVSFVYISFYNHTRKTQFLVGKTFKELWKQMILCFLFNFMLFTLGALSNEQRIDKKLIVYLFCVIGDVDIFIRKIPTEFLLIDFALSVYYLIPIENVYLKIACILINSVWFFIKDRLGIGLHDIFLILIQSLLFQDIRNLLYFDAFILILWGISGVLLKSIYRKSGSGRPSCEGKEKARIPLAPVIITAFMLSQLVS